MLMERFATQRLGGLRFHHKLFKINPRQAIDVFINRTIGGHFFIISQTNTLSFFAP